MGENGAVIPRDPRSSDSVPAPINLKFPIDFHGEFGWWTHEHHVAKG